MDNCKQYDDEIAFYDNEFTAFKEKRDEFYQHSRATNSNNIPNQIPLFFRIEVMGGKSILEELIAKYLRTEDNQSVLIPADICNDKTLHWKTDLDGGLDLSLLDEQCNGEKNSYYRKSYSLRKMYKGEEDYIFDSRFVVDSDIPVNAIANLVAKYPQLNFDIYYYNDAESFDGHVLGHYGCIFLRLDDPLSEDREQRDEAMA